MTDGSGKCGTQCKWPVCLSHQCPADGKGRHLTYSSLYKFYCIGCPICQTQTGQADWLFSLSRHVLVRPIWKAEMENTVMRSGYNAICVTDGSTYHVPNYPRARLDAKDFDCLRRAKANDNTHWFCVGCDGSMFEIMKTVTELNEKYNKVGHEIQTVIFQFRKSFQF